VQNKRTHQRVTVDCAASCKVGDAEPFTAHVKDVCLGGMYIESDVVMDFGTNLTITLVLPNSKAPLELPAVVRWHRPGGFGVQFGLLGARETHALLAFAG
jgi:Tfp pilus assembly protein PilZ